MTMSNDDNTLRSVGAAVTGHYKIFAYRKGAFYCLNDNLADVGTFTSRETAIANARRSIEHYRDCMGGKALSITARNDRNAM